MIPKSGNRFLEKVMLKQESGGLPVRATSRQILPKAIASGLRCPSPLPSPREELGEGIASVAAKPLLPVFYGEKMPAGR